MNKFKKVLAVIAAAITLCGSAVISGQASAHEWYHGHDYHYSRWYDRDHDDYDHRRDRDRYEFRRYERHDRRDRW